MAAGFSVMPIAIFNLLVLWCYLGVTNSSPINWDKVNLTKEQEVAVKRIDCVLNQFLKQLQNQKKKNNNDDDNDNNNNSTEEVDFLPLPSFP
ncbi:hypothetical protein Pmani_016870 [Petrolisthes manimaculis]|uniref:Uncharacterized protein n=1 Tax=Petrolisthes manimaculis TaxID=1843537 RepID=A0AAE1UAJ5_9EUCA|nr:hypothetical protein Pmani_016870 [Petrolisthes manimaculis]